MANSKTIEEAAKDYANSNFENCKYTYTDDNRLTNFDELYKAYKEGAEQFKAHEQKPDDDIKKEFEEKIMRLSEKDKDGDTWIETRNVFKLFRTVLKKLQSELKQVPTDEENPVDTQKLHDYLFEELNVIATESQINELVYILMGEDDYLKKANQITDEQIEALAEKKYPILETIKGSRVAGHILGYQQAMRNGFIKGFKSALQLTNK